MARARLTVASFNLRNLQLANAPVYASPAYYTDAEFDAKTSWIGDRLREMDADIIGFQEVWSVEALAACFAKAGLQEDYQIVARDAPDAGKVQVALAVRADMLRGDPVWHEDFPDGFSLIKRPPRGNNQPDNSVSVAISKFSRPVLEAIVKPAQRNAPEIRVLVAHLKSKRPVVLDRPERDRLASADETAIGSALSTIRRAAEASALRMLLNEATVGNDTPFIVLGDLNDDYLSVTTTIVTGDPSYRLFEASRVGRRKTKAGDIGLYSTQMLQEYRSLRNVHYTHIYRNKMEVLDHILVSEQFYDHAPNRIWSFHEMRYWNDYLERAEKERILSDHAAISASFDLNPISQAVDAVNRQNVG